jgi:hypothetical protein
VAGHSSASCFPSDPNSKLRMAQPLPIQTQSCDGYVHYVRSSSSHTSDVNERKISSDVSTVLRAQKFAVTDVFEEEQCGYGDC